MLPVKTHLLTLDDPIEVMRTYAAHLVQPGDVLTIGETPVAVIQNRYRHPVRLNLVLGASACRVFHPTSSLATAAACRP